MKIECHDTVFIYASVITALIYMILVNFSVFWCADTFLLHVWRIKFILMEMNGKKAICSAFWTEYVCSHLSHRRWEFTDFRSSACSSGLISDISFMSFHSNSHPCLHPYSTSRWCQEGEWKWDIKAMVSILQAAYDENFKTLGKVLCQKNTAEINLTRVIVPAERHSRSGTATHEGIHTALGFHSSE